MSVFADKDGQEWTLELTVGLVKQIRRRHRVDIMALEQGDLEKVAVDPVLLADVLFTICEVEAEHRGVTAEGFAMVLGGDAIDSATTALVEAIIDFFPQRRRPLLRQARAKLDRLQELQEKKLTEMVETADFEAAANAKLAEVQERLQAQLAGTSSGS